MAPLSVAEVPTLATRWQAQFTEIHKVTLFSPNREEIVMDAKDCVQR